LLAADHHPSFRPSFGSPSKLPQYQPCTAAFQKLSFAYETLSKPASRKLYDLSGQTDQAFSFESRPPGRPTSSYNPRKP
jgi:DnaJ-class molecular chaperone